MTKPCSFEGCTRFADPKAGFGLCKTHYHQLRTDGAPRPTPERFKRGDAMKWLVDHQDFAGDECLTWPFKRWSTGRGRVSYEGRNQHAHRVMCALVHGQPPSPEHEAAHSCGKGHEGCVNPRHLRWATHEENMADQIGHGTRLQGETQNGAKLTERQVASIRELAHTVTYQALADLFGISIGHAWSVANHTAWRHV